MRNLRLWIFLVVVGVLAVSTLLVWNVRSNRAEKELMLRLGSPGEEAEQYFWARIKPGMSYPEVLEAVDGTGYDRIESFLYFRSQIADTVLVQRFVYSYPWARDVTVSVLLGANARVIRLEMLNVYLKGLVPITAITGSAKAIKQAILKRTAPLLLLETPQ
jgi:hypothetical protein